MKRFYKTQWSLESPLLFIRRPQTLLHSHAYNFSIKTPNEASKVSIEAQKDENKPSKFHYKIRHTREVIAPSLFGFLPLQHKTQLFSLLFFQTHVLMPLFLSFFPYLRWAKTPQPMSPCSHPCPHQRSKPLLYLHSILSSNCLNHLLSLKGKYINLSNHW